MRLARISVLCVLIAHATSALARGDAARGASLYDSRCGACHSPDDNGPGPRHRGVAGRPAATQPGFDYSDALRRSGLVWTDANLDAWLANPNALVPGNKMAVRLASDAQDRGDLIAFLKSLRPASAGQPGVSTRQ
jgi:cytochrome c